MEVNIATYRSRIGRFNTAGHFSYIPENTRKQSYKSSTRTRTGQKFRILALFILLIISWMSRSEESLQSKYQVDF